jgi:hypothetical protein
MVAQCHVATAPSPRRHRAVAATPTEYLKLDAADIPEL